MPYKYFGTDGFRGEANKSLTADQAYKVGRFLGFYFVEENRSKGLRSKPKFVIGKDTRRSSYMFEYVLSAGLVASGADVYMMHVVPTPAVAYITKIDDFDCGIMITASHNPYYDNGIKLFNRNGEKLDGAVIRFCESYLDGEVDIFGKKYKAVPYAQKAQIGKIVDYISGRNRYIAYLISLGIYSLKGVKIGLDCANGTVWNIAKSVFDSLGASTYVINANPDGLNINKRAGSTHIEALQKFVISKGLDVGFAYDGDADRCICVDEKGNILNGDYVLYILAKYMKGRGELPSNTVVATIISNSGLKLALNRLGIECVFTSVGDKNVYDCMMKNEYALGGEQSGHIIFAKHGTTGDGILTSIKIIEAVLTEKKLISSLTNGFEPFPQVAKDIPVKDKKKILLNEEVITTRKSMEKIVGDEGKIIVRASGTEEIIRILVESKSFDICKYVANALAEIIYRENSK